MYEYELETSLGVIKVTPLTRYNKDGKIMHFALTKETHGYCHMAAEEFIRENPKYTAITSLVNNQFGERQYHSYIETPDGYVDFANNAHFSKADFARLFSFSSLYTPAKYPQARALVESKRTAFLKFISASLNFQTCA